MMKPRIAHELRKEINRRFAEEGIEIAVPQRKIYLQERKE
jgi:small-conductance mechanosensitive channel